MWRYSLLLLIALPPLAITLNHDTISAILIIVWTMLVIPICILQAIDYLSRHSHDQSPLIKNLLRVPVGCFGLLSFIMGAALVAWCLYNVCVRRLPEYTGPTDILSLLFSGFGIGPGLMAFGCYWMALALNPAQVMPDEPADEFETDADGEGQEDEA